MQITLAQTAAVAGLGLHTGRPARVVLRPAPVGHGIAFRRVDLPGRPVIPALWDRVEPGPLATRLVAGAASVSTVEHLMAALSGAGVANALVECDGPEAPILDGSSLPWLRAILGAGLVAEDAPRLAWAVREAVEARAGDAVARLEPLPGRFEMDFLIDFPAPAIGRQRLRLDMANGAFARELSDCRTFCLRGDVEAMRARGLALGGTLENAVVVEGDRVLSPGGLRRPDEAVRHKMLDALGDLALAGGPILGRYVGERAGHSLTNALLRAAFARGGALAPVACDTRLLARLPGAGLMAADLPAVA